MTHFRSALFSLGNVSADHFVHFTGSKAPQYVGQSHTNGQSSQYNGVPEMLVSDNGSIFLSHDTRRVCAQLGIEKKEIKKGKPYQNYIEAAFGVQRRMADWSFEKAQTWEDLLAAHDKWMRDYNFQKHMAHEERQDGCHSPAEVLGWIKGMQPEEAVVHEAFSAICETRRLEKAGYAKFRNWSHDARTRPGRGDHAGQYLPGFPHPGV
jgi:hypothetical protein